MGGATTDFATTQLEHARNVGKETSDLGSDPGPDPGPDPSLLGLAHPEGTKLPWTELPLGKAVDTLGRWQPLSFYSFDNSYSSSAPPCLLPGQVCSRPLPLAGKYQECLRALGSSQLSCLRADREKCSIPTTHWGTQASHRCRGTLFIHNAHSSQHFPCCIPAP